MEFWYCYDKFVGFQCKSYFQAIMAMGGATGGRTIMFMPPKPPGTSAAPTVLSGTPAAAGTTGKRSLRTKY